ncbi:MAG: hypothetical protein FWF22_05320 [Treponema sp.]|nr:hypothetical protein [Treponema sp.]
MTSDQASDIIVKKAEEQFGIKTDPGDAKRLHSWICEKYGSDDQRTIDSVFLSGEAAEFLTVNETYFFREPSHFIFLRDLLPSFEKTGLQICCAAVSSGCEAYSIAMLIETYNRDAKKNLRYSIDAFDINRKAINTACQGDYSARTMREDGSSFHYIANRYLKKTESAAGIRYQADLSLKKNINFFVYNLMDRLEHREYDIIFFRNAFIYFTQRNRERILSNLISVLGEDGILISGISETSLIENPDIESKNRKDVFYFQKKTAGRNPFTEAQL